MVHARYLGTQIARRGRHRDAQCADGDAEVHRVLLEKVLPRQASVISSDDFLVTLSA